jgi:hypothetical protein
MDPAMEHLLITIPQFITNLQFITNPQFITNLLTITMPLLVIQPQLVPTEAEVTPNKTELANLTLTVTTETVQNNNY